MASRRSIEETTATSGAQQRKTMPSYDAGVAAAQACGASTEDCPPSRTSWAAFGLYWQQMEDVRRRRCAVVLLLQYILVGWRWRRCRRLPQEFQRPVAPIRLAFCCCNHMHCTRNFARLKHLLSFFSLNHWLHVFISCLPASLSVRQERK